MSRTTTFGAALLAGALALTMTACGGGDSSSPAAAGGGGDGGLRIGFSQATQQSPFYVALGDGAKAEAEADGNQFFLVDANNDVTKQNNDVQDLITRGIDVLLLNPVDPQGVAPSLAAAKAADVQVVTVDRPVASGAAAHVGRDNVAMGKLVGEQVVATLGDAGGKVIEIQGDAGGAVAKDRSQGFHDAVDPVGAIQVVEGPYANYVRAEAITAMQDLLQANPDVKAVYAHNDDMALGALQVLQENDRTDVKVFGVDGLMEAVQAIANGDQYVATSFNDPQKLGAAAVDTAVKVANGDPVDAFVDAGTGLIDKDDAPALVGDTTFAVQPAA